MTTASQPAPLRAAFINPNLVAQRNDLFTTGIVYLPVSLAFVVASVRRSGHPVTVIDAFGEKPEQARRDGKFLILGLRPEEVVERLPADVDVVFVYAINLTWHLSTAALVKAVKEARPDATVVVLENTQAVSAYALQRVAGEFYQAGADYILTGEGEHRAVALLQALRSAEPGAVQAVDGLGGPGFHLPPKAPIADLDALPLPAWDLFPMTNYWALRHAHGPQGEERYMPLLTSRGCPYPCRFCVVPATNNQRWRPRSAAHVVAEMETWHHRWGVREFHIEDLDPTISDERIRDMCDEIEKRGLDVVWKIVAGTKVETIRNEETIRRMAAAGCRYISISPETGSPRLLKAMRKPFNLDHAVRLVHEMNRVGIHSQACFVLGFPGETEEDRRLTWNLVRELTRQGVDEVALFIITPVPGSAIHDEFSGYEQLSDLNFTPTWRQDYRRLVTYRLHLYIHFLVWKLWYHPRKILAQPYQFARRVFRTKMEMAPYRAMVLRRLDRRAVES